MTSSRQGLLSPLEGFLCGGTAACTAVTVSNPAEVAKTRMQLQGELAKGGGQRVYNNALDALAKTWRNEGIRGLQRGLGAAVYSPPWLVFRCETSWDRAATFANTLEAFYEHVRRAFNNFVGKPPIDQIPLTSISAGAAYSPALPVGTQRYYKSSFNAFTTIWKAEKFRGLIRGIDAAVLRTTIGSSVLLPSYYGTKHQIVSNGLLPENSIWTYLASSSVSTICVALTRLYNQPTKRLPNGTLIGTLYKNPIDCLWKTIQAEGIRGCYKGSTAQLLQVAPHTIIILTANDIIRNIYTNMKSGHPEDV
ncbi:hypothetical protein SERLADRAFT_408779 [Serpula lacrymans var. lacrymans S7.9]|uniref:Mitochondrial carrier protein n=1 Tax=Serpula lacrymans var. lacrymans (strain S7.9) TaxID=578457 RepID=F8NWM5_SERL9|nr:uncharacterized protein SERLADRAFT_408779 [Serpula lacrymans var. lacrymans S7.9]EGO25049.1 hypothetical protein SERLADRAFT_408779 [Serpula lacrymans var. lacrymans S7.9]